MREAELKAIAQEEYTLAVEAEKQAKADAQAKADEWYRLAEIEAKAKIAAQEAKTKIAAAEARAKAEEEFRLAAEEEKRAMVQAREKANEWHRFAQLEAEATAQGEMRAQVQAYEQEQIQKQQQQQQQQQQQVGVQSHSQTQPPRVQSQLESKTKFNVNLFGKDNEELKAAEAWESSRISTSAASQAQNEQGGTLLSLEAQLAAEKSMHGNANTIGNGNGNSQKGNGNGNSQKGNGNGNGMSIYAGMTEAEAKDAAVKKANAIADSQRMMSVQRERFIAEAKINAVVELRRANAMIEQAQEEESTLQQGPGKTKTCPLIISCDIL